MDLVKGLCSLVSTLLGLYSFIIFIRIILSWVLLFSRNNGWRSGNGGYGYNQENPNNPSGLVQAEQIFAKITDPYLNMFKGVKSLRRSTLDLTPVLALVVLNLVKNLCSMVAQAGSVNLWVLLAFVVQAAWNLGSFLLVLLVILLVIRYFVGKSNSFQALNFVNTIDPILDGPVGKVYKLFFRNKRDVEDQKLVLVSIFYYIVLLVVLKGFVNILISFLLSF